jgi:outer membrane biosynthesis protein TonB
MRDFVLLLAVGLLLVIGVGWFLLPGRARDLLTGSNVTVQSDTTETPPEKIPVPPAPRRRVRPVPEPEETVAARSVPHVVPAPAQPVATPEPVNLNFPAPGDVTAGQDREQLIDEYGSPALSASTQDRGHLFETYVYRRERSVAIINLQDGRVAGVSIGQSAPSRRK